MGDVDLAVLQAPRAEYLVPEFDHPFGVGRRIAYHQEVRAPDEGDLGIDGGPAEVVVDHLRRQFPDRVELDLDDPFEDSIVGVAVCLHPRKASR